VLVLVLVLVASDLSANSCQWQCEHSPVAMNSQQCDVPLFFGMHCPCDVHAQPCPQHGTAAQPDSQAFVHLPGAGKGVGAAGVGGAGVGAAGVGGVGGVRTTGVGGGVGTAGITPEHREMFSPRTALQIACATAVGSTVVSFPGVLYISQKKPPGG
jgi:hypothetical protein